MKTERVQISKLKPDPNNARKHGEQNLAAIKASLQRFGQQHPIIVDEDNVVRAGNGRVEAMRALGWTECDVVRTSLKGSDATAFAIADNRTAELAEWDEAELANQLSEISTVLQVEDLGFTESEVKRLLSIYSVNNEAEKAVLSESDLTSSALQYSIIVFVKNEEEQRVLINDIESRGLKCRALIS